MYMYVYMCIFMCCTCVHACTHGLELAVCVLLVIIHPLLCAHAVACILVAVHGYLALGHACGYSPTVYSCGHFTRLLSTYYVQVCVCILVCNITYMHYPHSVLDVLPIGPARYSSKLCWFNTMIG